VQKSYQQALGLIRSITNKYIARHHGYLLFLSSKGQLYMRIETKGEPRVGVQFDGEVVDHPTCLEVIVTLLIGSIAFWIILTQSA
jgi:hypothetical protein